MMRAAEAAEDCNDPGASSDCNGLRAEVRRLMEDSLNEKRRAQRDQLALDNV
jgi:hypothetical protein